MHTSVFGYFFLTHDPLISDIFFFASLFAQEATCNSDKQMQTGWINETPWIPPSQLIQTWRAKQLSARQILTRQELNLAKSCHPLALCVVK